MSDLQHPSDYCPPSDMHDYLGHFGKKKNYNAGHNNMSIKLGGGGRFAKFSGHVAQEYEDKGYSEAEAEKIGAAVAAKAGRAKYGAKKMASMAAKGH